MQSSFCYRIAVDDRKEGRQNEKHVLEELVTIARGHGYLSHEETVELRYDPKDYVLFCFHCKLPVVAPEKDIFDDKIRCEKCGKQPRLLGHKDKMGVNLQAGEISIPQFFVGRYKVLDRLGAGGYGIVFRAYDFELDRECAIKVVSAKDVFPEHVTRFQREATVTARLNHPNIVKIYDFGKQGDLIYYAMEFLKGETLREIMSKRRISMGAALRIVRDCALAMHHAHLKDIIHRDIKPGNIMIVSQEDSVQIEEEKPLHDTRVTFSTGAISGSYRVVLMDFGIAKSVEFDNRLTRTGDIVGTPYYMSPEQAAGFTKKLNPTTDVYSLGVVLYELITGEVPFRGDYVQMLMRKIQYKDPPPVTQKVKNIDPDLESIVMKAMMKEQRMRYQTALEFADDCERYLRGEPIRARKPGIVYSMRRGIKRNWKVLAPITAAVLAVLAYAGISSIVERAKEARIEEGYRSRKEAIESRAANIISDARADISAGKYSDALKSVEQLDSLAVYRDRERFPRTEFGNDTRIEKFIPFNIPLTEGNLLAAHAASMNGDTGLAGALLMKAFSVSTSDEEKRRSLLAVGIYNLRNDLFDQADYFFALVQKYFPSNREALVFRSCALLSLGRHALAKKLLEEFIKTPLMEPAAEQSNSMVRHVWEEPDLRKTAAELLQFVNLIHPRKIIFPSDPPIAAGDFDGDGVDEIVTPAENGALTVQKWNGAAFKETSRIENAYPANESPILSVRNGREVTIAYGDMNHGGLRIFAFRAGKFEIVLDEDIHSRPIAQSAADINGDERQELAVGTGPYARGVGLYGNSGRLVSLSVASDPGAVQIVQLPSVAGKSLFIGTGPWAMNDAYRLFIFNYSANSNIFQLTAKTKVGAVGGAAYIGEISGVPSFSVSLYKWPRIDEIYRRLGIQLHDEATYLFSLKNNRFARVCKLFGKGASPGISVSGYQTFGANVPALAARGDHLVSLPPLPLTFRAIGKFAEGTQAIFTNSEGTFIGGIAAGQSEQISEAQFSAVRIDSAEVLLKGTESFLKRNDLPGAEKYLKDLIKILPDRRREASMNLAYIYRRQLRWKELLDLYRDMTSTSIIDAMTSERVRGEMDDLDKFLKIEKRVSLENGTLLCNFPLAFHKVAKGLVAFGNTGVVARIMIPVAYSGNAAKVSALIESEIMEWGSSIHMGIRDFDSGIGTCSMIARSLGETNMPRMSFECDSSVPVESNQPDAVSDISEDCDPLVTNRFRLESCVIPRYASAFNKVTDENSNAIVLNRETILREVPYFTKGFAYASLEPAYVAGDSFKARIRIESLELFGDIVAREFSPSSPSEFFLAAGGNFVAGKFNEAISDYESFKAAVKSWGEFDAQLCGFDRDRAMELADFFIAIADLRNGDEARGREILDSVNSARMLKMFKQTFHALAPAERSALAEILRPKFQPAEIIKSLGGDKLSYAILLSIYPEGIQFGLDGALQIVPGLSLEMPSAAVDLCEREIIPNVKSTGSESLPREMRVSLASALNTVGAAYLSAGKDSDAIDWFKKALTACPKWEEKDEELENRIRWLRYEIEENLRRCKSGRDY